ncbi:MAG: AAA family ATPase, partial [Gemmatimonadales bacterium]
DRAVPRAELASLLWEERDDARARQSLRQALLELKRVLGPGITTEGEQVRLDPAAVRLDVGAFEAAIAAGRPGEAVEWWEGDFLAGLEELGGEAFRTWLEVERAALRRSLALALDRLVGDARARGDWDQAVGWAERWARALPLEERGQIRLVETLRLAARTREAHTRYTGFAARLRTELDLDPSPELQRLGAQVEREWARGDPAHRPGSAALFTPDLVGRNPAMAELAAAWQSALAGERTLVLVEGETGIGKTRLVEEFLRRLGGGAPVVAVSVSAADAGAAGSSAARDLLSGLATAPGLAAVSPAALAAMAALVPRLRERFPTLPPATDDTALDDAAAEALSAVAEERPVVLFVDDLESADQITRSMVAAAARRATGRILIIAAVGTDEHPTSTGLASISGTARTRRLKLQPLTPGEVESLMASMLVLPPADRHALAGRLHAEGGGNPLYTIELAAALVDEGVLAVGDQGSWRLTQQEGWTAPLPSGLRATVGRRIGRLGADARAVAEAMATLEPAAEEGAVRTRSGLSADRFDLGRDELVVRRLIRLAPGRLGVFQFSHELIRRTIRESLAETPDAAPSQAAFPTPSRRRPLGRILFATALVAAASLAALLAQRYLAARSSAATRSPRDIVVARPDVLGAEGTGDTLTVRSLQLAIER